jgi:hypothetical protein
VKLFSFKRRWIVGAAVVLLLLFLLRPGASSRLKSRIASSIGAALARPVEIGSVHLRLLPRPGFDLENLVVYDDPVFGAEPILRASEVTAVLRLTSLVRGRMEIARLDMTEPSLNLVHGDNGRWNLEVLLERTAHTPLAPTGKAKSEARPGFPYIEASSARINFKVGQVKKPYALTNADFALWQDSENAWGVRLKAQPFRSDLNLSDTGTLRATGTWQRAASLRETPLQFSLEWDRPQLGQLTKFLTGSDKGWRGAVMLDVTLAGTPAKLQVTSDASIRDFRRYDISSGEPLTLAAHCDGQYSSIDHTVHELFCQGPVGDGLVSLHGDLGLPGNHKYGVVLTAEKVPASAAVTLARRAKKNLPDDLAATGTVEGTFAIRANGASVWGAQFEGRGEIADLRLVSASNKAELSLGVIPFALTSDESREKASLPKRSRVKGQLAGAQPSGPRVEFGPFPVSLGHATQAAARGWVGRSGYSVSLAGEAEVARTLRVARLFGLPALAATADGTAQMDLLIAGSWTGLSAGVPPGFSQPQLSGTAKLRNVRAEVRGVEGPIEISSAALQLSPEEVRVTKLSATAADAIWTGSLELPRGCGKPGSCVVRFNLSANEIGLRELSQWVNPRPKNQPWYKAFTTAAPAETSFLGSLHAFGKVTVSRLLVHGGFAATHVSASVNLDRGKLKISDLRGDFLGGNHRGEWQADFSVQPPTYSGDGILTSVSLGQVADAMKDQWIAGMANGSYEVTSEGSSATEFWKSADGTLRFEINQGTLPHIALVSEAGPLKVEGFEGSARLREGKLEIKDALLNSAGGAFLVNGTASVNQELDLKLTRESESKPARADFRGYTITGTLAEPRVAPLVSPETQARLKP